MHLYASRDGLSVLSGQELFTFLLHVKYTHLPSQDLCKFKLITTSGSGSKSRISWTKSDQWIRILGQDSIKRVPFDLKSSELRRQIIFPSCIQCKMVRCTQEKVDMPAQKMGQQRACEVTGPQQPWCPTRHMLPVTWLGPSCTWFCPLRHPSFSIRNGRMFLDQKTSLPASCVWKLGEGQSPVFVLSLPLSVLEDIFSLKTLWDSCVSDHNIFCLHHTSFWNRPSQDCRNYGARVIRSLATF